MLQINILKKFSHLLFPYEANLTLLNGKKDYNLHKNIIEIYMKSIQYDSHNNSHDELIEELDAIITLLSENYLSALLSKFPDIGYKIDNFNMYLRNKKSILLINLIERKLTFSSEDELIQFQPIAGESPKNYSVKETEDLAQTLREYIEAENKLLEYIESSPPSSEIEYIKIVIYSEFWNYLSHLSFALNFSKEIENFQQNITRATRHLERAILDIYKFLIISKDLVDVEILKIRLTELTSMGDNNGTINTYENYKKVVCRK